MAFTMGARAKMMDITTAGCPLAPKASSTPNAPNAPATPATNTGDFALCDKRGSDHAKVVILDMSGRPRLSEYLADGSKPSCT